ncbi:hypothetical protein RF11_13705 [Thelohanellus kitauei]|uniref:Dynactin subunit 6 n=1 Tax=Thelohanellus kitauei TaxID=669202 RepID=A0A0C2MXC2_THEKT|nr:hypothetical protein RF11_13705 [Thelohanellus kitauei]
MDNPNTIQHRRQKTFHQLIYGPETMIEVDFEIISAGEAFKIGKGNVFQTKARIINDTNTAIVIENNNNFGIGCIITPKSIGSNNTFMDHCVVNHGTIIRNNVTIGPKIVVPANSKISDGVILFGSFDFRIREL